MQLNAMLLIGLAGTLLVPGVALAAEQQGRESQAYAEPGPAAPAAAGGAAVLTDERIAKQVAEQLGVQVLGIAPTDAEGPPIYAVRVMNPPGNDNAAFLVSTVLVDATTGAILGELRLAPSADQPDVTPLTRTPEDADGGLDLRRRTYR